MPGVWGQAPSGTGELCRRRLHGLALCNQRWLSPDEFAAVLFLNFVHMVQVLGDIVIEFLLDLPSYLLDFFHDCIFHTMLQSPPL